MPCWEVNLMSVKLEAADKKLLMAAANKTGLSVRYNENRLYLGPITVDMDKGVAQFDSYYANTFNKLKVQYSKQVVEKVAKAKGWTGSWMRNTEKPTVKLRRY